MAARLFDYTTFLFCLEEGKNVDSRDGTDRTFINGFVIRVVSLMVDDGGALIFFGNPSCNRPCDTAVLLVQFKQGNLGIISGRVLLNIGYKVFLLFLALVIEVINFFEQFHDFIVVFGKQKLCACFDFTHPPAGIKHRSNLPTECFGADVIFLQVFDEAVKHRVLPVVNHAQAEIDKSHVLWNHRHYICNRAEGNVRNVLRHAVNWWVVIFSFKNIFHYGADFPCNARTAKVFSHLACRSLWITYRNIRLAQCFIHLVMVGDDNIHVMLLKEVDFLVLGDTVVHRDKRNIMVRVFFYLFV